MGRDVGITAKGGAVEGVVSGVVEEEDVGPIVGERCVSWLILRGSWLKSPVRMMGWA